MSLQPFIEEDQPVLAFFPQRYYALAFPIFVGVVGFSFVLIALGAWLLADQIRIYRKKRSAVSDKEKES